MKNYYYQNNNSANGGFSSATRVSKKDGKSSSVDLDSRSWYLVVWDGAQKHSVSVNTGFTTGPSGFTTTVGTTVLFVTNGQTNNSSNTSFRASGVALIYTGSSSGTATLTLTGMNAATYYWRLTVWKLES